MNSISLILQGQIKSIQENWPNWKCWIQNKDSLILEGDIQPTIVSPHYIARIYYKPGINPEINIIEPKLILYPGKNSLPHVYSKNGAPLCLFFFYEFDNRKDHLGETIIIWITWWLYFYEIWSQTGQWVARGTHPDRW
jgi:hypothetical protein